MHKTPALLALLAAAACSPAAAPPCTSSAACGAGAVCRVGAAGPRCVAVDDDGPGLRHSPALALPVVVRGGALTLRGALTAGAWGSR